MEGFIIYDTIRRDILFAESKEEVELFFNSAKRNKEEYTVTKVDFDEQEFPDEIIKKCSDGILILNYGKAITPAEEAEFANFIEGITENCYHNLYELISNVEKLVLSKNEEKFVINTIHRLYGFLGRLKDEIENACEYYDDYITLLNFSRVLDKVLESENSKEMRDEYYNILRRVD